MSLVQAIELTKHFTVKTPLLGLETGLVKAVNGVSFSIDRGETLGLVGESGSGKTTTGKLLLRLLQPTSGSILFEGRELNRISDREMRRLRKEIQVVFQNPYAALDTKMTAEDILTQPLSVHQIVPPLEFSRETARLLELVGLSAKDRRKFPHEFSGGQRQRIGIARAIATRPKLIVCDEPVSALDVSVQAQILNLLTELQQEFKLAYLFVAHGLNVIRHVSHRVAVMYLGKIVEMGEGEALFGHPLHPYTQALLSAVLTPQTAEKRERIRLKDEIPSPLALPQGCLFHPRCRFCMTQCTREEPALREIDGRLVACHLLSRNAVSEEGEK